MINTEYAFQLDNQLHFMQYQQLDLSLSLRKKKFALLALHSREKLQSELIVVDFFIPEIVLFYLILAISSCQMTLGHWHHFVVNSMILKVNTEQANKYWCVFFIDKMNSWSDSTIQFYSSLCGRMNPDIPCAIDIYWLFISAKISAILHDSEELEKLKEIPKLTYTLSKGNLFIYLFKLGCDRKISISFYHTGS